MLGLLMPSSGMATPPSLPVGEANGVRIVKQRGAIVVVFTKPAARLYRRLAGKRVTVSCTEMDDGKKLGFRIVSTGGTTFRAPKRGRRLETGDMTPGQDYCRVWLAARTVKRQGRVISRSSRDHVVSIPLTQAGAVHLDEELKTFLLLSVLLRAGVEADDRKSGVYPTADQMLAAFGPPPRSPDRRHRLPYPLVALANAGDTPPSGSIGYYSDGQLHVAAAAVSASGRRLFIEYMPDKVLRTNVADYMFDEPS